MNQENLFKPLTDQSKTSVVETVNALIEWSNEKNIPPHVLTAISLYYEQLVKLANESTLIEKEIQANLVKDFKEEEQHESGPVTKSDV